jgi:TonB family protein
MGYQALLFCPDEKTARTVTQVLGELDFAVIPCTEPFAAVKKLMGEHFDAVVVDCDNEQNATLLFKSARNAPNNHSSLAVAVVEGQAGVAKAFRIGANLVLTKPVNVEQAKGTLRVARGLLRKSEAAKPATGAATTAAKPAAPAAAPPKLVPQRTIPPVSTAGAAGPISPWVARAAASIPTQKPAELPRVVASVPSEDAETDTDILEAPHKEIATPSIVGPEVKKAAGAAGSLSSTVEHSPSSGRVGTGAASAPARELKPGVAAGDKTSTVISEPESAVEEVAAEVSISPAEETTASPSSFTLGGNVSSESASAGRKKALLAVAAVVLIAAVGYAVWMQWVSSSGAATPFTRVSAKPVTTGAKIPPAATNMAPIAPSPAASSSVPSSTAATPETDTRATTSTQSAQPHETKARSGADLATLPASTVAENKVPSVLGIERPIVIKSHPAHPGVGKPASSSEVAAPSMAGIAAAGNSSSLPNLMTGSKAPTPMLQDVHVSQGVSRGLLVKEIPPVYPASARQLRIEGAVELLATISKNGDISAVKVLSGEPQLAHAAVEAVKQWKYKPYLLNGEPVEIQTQVTVKFKLPG